MTTEKRTSCLEAWPECQNGAHNPACCRFPKPCACEYVVKADTTPEPEPEPEPEHRITGQAREGRFVVLDDPPRTYLHGDEEREAFRKKLQEMRDGSMPAYIGPKAGRDR